MKSMIRDARESKGLSLDEVGRRLGITRQAVLRLEQSEAEGGISLTKLSAVAGVLGFDLHIELRPKAGPTLEQHLESVFHSMELELQGLSEEDRVLIVREAKARYGGDLDDR